MKARSPRYYGRGAALVQAAVAGAALMFAALACSSVYANDAASADSDWEPLDQVLVIPPVYKPAAKTGAPATLDVPSAPPGCAAARPDSHGDGAVAVAGTADSDCAQPADAQAQDSPSDSAQAQGDSTQPDSSGPAQPPAADAGAGDAAAAADPAVGTIDDYQQQEAAAAVAAGAGIGQVPIVVGPPLVPYYLPRAYAAPAPPMNHIYVPSPTFGRTPPRASWMPQPTAPMVTAPPAWMPQPAMPMTAAPAPMFIPRSFGNVGGRSGFGGMGGWRR